MSNTIKVNKSLRRNADTIKVSTLHTRASVNKNSINLERRTVDVTFGTSTPVQMYDWELGSYLEVLSFEDGHVRMDRINAGAPVLDHHDRYEQVGVVESARIENGVGVATLRYSKNKDADEIWNDVVDGIKTKVSVGYNVYEYQEITLPGDSIRTLKAIDWEPSEISNVSKPADINSGVRSPNEQPKNVKISQLNRSVMTPEEKAAKEAADKKAADDKAKKDLEDAQAAEQAEKPAGDGTAAPASEDATRAAAEGSKNRSLAIMQMCRLAGLPQTEVETYVASSESVDQVREKIMKKFEAGDPNSGSSNVRVGTEAIEKRREAMTAGIVLRAMGSRALSDKIITADQATAGNEYRGDSLLDLARMCLDNIGVKHRGMDKMELVRSAITSSGSDFPVLLQGTNRRILLASYENAADVWRRFCAVGSVSDFREWSRLRMGSIGDLDKIGENGEYKTKKLNDASYEKIKADTKGNLINVSRQMIINDDLGGITKFAQQLGRAAARSIENDVFRVLGLNAGLGPLMVDGKTLFHADHGNIAGTAAAPSVASLGAVKVQMKKIKDQDSNDYLNLTPALWLGPVDLEEAANLANDSQYSMESNKFQVPNTSRGTYKEIIGTPRLSGTPWYSFADPSVEPVIEVVFLDGNETPFLDSEEGFTQDGITWKVRHDWGVGAVGYRGAVRNAGA
jgi:hypothetical protein